MRPLPGCMDEKYVNLTAVVEAAGAFVPYVFNMRFAGMDYPSLMVNAAKLQSFKLDVRTRVSLSVGLDVGLVEVSPQIA